MKNAILTGLMFVLSTGIFGVPKANAMGSGGNGWVFNPALMYIVDSTTSGTVTNTTNRLLADLSLGYKFETSPLYVGAEYNIDNTNTTQSSATTTTNYWMYGPSVGLVTDNFFLLFSYFFAAQEDMGQSSGTTSYINGTGFMGRLGYRFMLSSSFSLGPMLAYRNVSYPTQKNPNGSTQTVTQSDSHFLPYITMWFNF